MRLTTLILLAVLTSPLVAEIDVPEEIQSPPNPIVATVDADIPEGAQSKGRWEIEGGAEAQFIKANGNTVYIWAQPGEYVLSYTGMWVDFDAKTFDFIEEQASVLVTTEDTPDPDPEPDPDPDPDPDPEPDPADEYQVLILHDADMLSRLPRAQRDILISRKRWQQLEDAGHKLLRVFDVFDAGEEASEHHQKFLDAMEGKTIPRVAIAPREGGTIETFPLPEDFDALMQRLGGE